MRILKLYRKAKHSSDDEDEKVNIPTTIPSIVIEGIGSEPLDDEPELPKKKQKVKNKSPSPKRSPRSRTPKSSSSIIIFDCITNLRQITIISRRLFKFRRKSLSITITFQISPTKK